MSMSLRSFHLFFIAVSVLLAAWVGVWGVQSWLATRNGSDLTLGLLFVVLGVVLLVYGLRVRRKLRELAPEDDD
jgi:succinate dehydrogenase hydrophobic anchor subunit